MAKASTVADTKSKKTKSRSSPDAEMPRTAAKSKKGTRGDGGKKKKGKQQRLLILQ